MTRARVAALVVLVAFLLTGCWDLVEIDRRTVILGVAFDAAPGNRVRTMLSVPDPRALVPAGGTVIGPPVEEPAYIVLEHEARTASEAISKLRQVTSRELFFGQVMVVGVSERLARKGLAPVFDFLMNNTEIPRSAWFVVTAGPPDRILAIKPPQETFPEFYLDNAFRARRKPAATEGVPYWRAWVASLRPGEDAVVPVVEIGPLGQLRLDRLAVFRDDRLAGILSEGESALFSLSRGATQSTWEVRLDGGRVVTMRPIRATFEIHVEPDAAPGRPAFRFEERIDVVLAETPVNGSLTAREVLVVERHIAETMTASVRRLIEHLQRWKSDPYGFGERYRIAFPERFRTEPWPDQWSRARVDIRVQVQIRRRGAIADPFAR